MHIAYSAASLKVSYGWHKKVSRQFCDRWLKMGVEVAGGEKTRLEAFSCCVKGLVMCSRTILYKNVESFNNHMVDFEIL